MTRGPRSAAAATFSLKGLFLATWLLSWVTGCSLFVGETSDAGIPTDATALDLGDAAARPDAARDAAGVPANLELHIDFEGLSSQSLSDRSGNNRDGSRGSGSRTTRSGKHGIGLELSGTLDQAIDFGDVLDDLPQLTIEVWVKAGATLPGWDAVVTNYGVSDGYWLGSALGHNGAAEWRVRSSAIVSVAQPFDGNWNHLAATYDTRTTPGELVLYVNGIEDARGVLAGQQAPDAPDFDFLLGAGGIGRRPFVGTLDDLKVWSEVRTEAQICADAGGRYVGGFSPDCRDL